MNCLIVDDDFSSAMVFKFMLSDIIKQVDITAVTSFRKANEEICNTSYYGLFFIDMMLDNGHTGSELIKNIRKQVHYNTVPVIIATSLKKEEILK